MNINWLSLTDAARVLHPSHYGELADNGSLTRRIRTNCTGIFAVKLIDQRVIQPTTEERNILALPDSTQAFSRRVYLCCDDQPKIFAKTIIGLNDKNQVLTERIDQLGEQSLGSLLFRDPLATKKSVQLAQIPLNHIFFERLRLTQYCQSKAVWVRRNLYEYLGCSLIVYEAYLYLLD